MYAAHAVQRNPSYSACHDKVPDVHLYLPPKAPPPAFPFAFPSPAACPHMVLWPPTFGNVGFRNTFLATWPPDLWLTLPDWG